MKLKLSRKSFNEKLKELSQEYEILAPVSLNFQGKFSDTDLVTYKSVTSLNDMEWRKKSDYSPKEITFPITQILFYFTEDEFKESNIDKRKKLVFLRACDINGMKRVDEIYLNNGVKEDYYYKKLRENVKYVLVGCKESYRNCFCVSMDSNKTDEYAIGMNIEGNDIYLHIKDDDLKVFEGDEVDFEVDFVRKNLFDVNVPNIEDIDLKEIAHHEMWDEYNSRCIACGRCNFVCTTCTCYTMQDVYYKDNEKSGERRRIWAGCHVDGFTSMAGGHEFRKTKGERMRFKALHKVYDYKKRFGYNMCVGCGRCDDACPQYISFSTCIDKISDVVKGGK